MLREEDRLGEAALLEEGELAKAPGPEHSLS
jgi:hypothetical protein